MTTLIIYTMFCAILSGPCAIWTITKSIENQSTTPTAKKLLICGPPLIVFLILILFSTLLSVSNYHLPETLSQQSDSQIIRGSQIALMTIATITFILGYSLSSFLLLKKIGETEIEDEFENEE